MVEQVAGDCVTVESKLSQACRRCQELEERERELLRNQGSMQEALAQLGARAEAAEQKLETRHEEMRAEYDELMALLRTNSAASLKVQPAQQPHVLCMCPDMSPVDTR